MWAETRKTVIIQPNSINFNPLRPCGRRRMEKRTNISAPYFNPLRPCGRRRLKVGWIISSFYFNPLRPCGRRLKALLKFRRLQIISIHSARVGGDAKGSAPRQSRRNFNPLRPCGRRHDNALDRPRPAYFNPLRPCGRRPVLLLGAYNSPPISIHSARVGGDKAHAYSFRAPHHFNPLRPCGRRHI